LEKKTGQVANSERKEEGPVEARGVDENPIPPGKGVWGGGHVRWLK